MLRKVSALDVARRAGVSRTTVSFVLNNTIGKHISEKTRQNVLRAAQELSYRPDEMARKLAITKHHAVGLFISHTRSIYTDVYITRFVEGMATVLNRYRLQLVLHAVGLEQARYLELAREDGVEGLILLSTHGDDQGLIELLRSGFPLVVIGRLAEAGVPQVDIDNVAAAHSMVTHLADLGHRRIAMITHAPLAYSGSRERLEGYRQVLEARGLERRDEWVRVGEFNEESGYAAMRELLKLSERPTAVFAGNDVIAFGALSALRDANLRVPQDISLAGFDDDFLSRYLTPPLTTVSLPAAGLGAKAVSMLVELLADPASVAPRQVILPTRLSIRGSTAPPEA